MKQLTLLLFLLPLFIFSCAQSTKPKLKDWHLLDFDKDGYRGISLNQAYELLKGKKSKTVLIAVIDSGIDTLQDDIKDQFWQNPGEIPGNKIDDDKNGLVDDVMGWNFLGGPSGENLSVSVPEAYRTYHRFKNDFEKKSLKNIPNEQQYVFSEWKRAEKIIDVAWEKAKKEVKEVRENFSIITATSRFLMKHLNKVVFTRTDIVPAAGNDSLGYCMSVWKSIFNTKDFSNADFIKDYERYLKQQEDAITQKTTPPTPYRDNLLQDNGYDITKVVYGNSNLQTHSGYHGTSMSGVIGATRNNGKGIDGIADNVKIMMLRAALGSDEYDKDVALAIRYAVDHGAQVINMSFGKPVSPDKKWVDDAIKYAQEKDVVLVHGSGNDAKNTDVDFFYPNAFYLDGSRMPHFINVGASGDYSNGGLAADFTNYGKKMVDIFAPGVDVHCSIANNGTQEASGTSLSSPIVAGIAALLRSYYPRLTAPQVVEIILASGIYIEESVALPGNSSKKIAFDKLSETGKIVNACKAVKLAQEKYGN
jgi:subtilisin family serine protease